MRNILFGIFFVIVGCAMVLKHRSWGRQAIEQRNRQWGTKYGEISIFFSSLMCLILGLAFVLFGILSILAKGP